jgi:hypothetical protein
MTIRARELKVDSKLFSNARTYAIKDHVVITFCRKDGSSGRLQGEKISVSTR